MVEGKGVDEGLKGSEMEEEEKEKMKERRQERGSCNLMRKEERFFFL